MMTDQTRLTAKAIHLRLDGTCINCNVPIHRTGTRYPWFHSQTGNEQCRPRMLTPIEFYALPRSEIALPALKSHA